MKKPEKIKLKLSEDDQLTIYYLYQDNMFANFDELCLAIKKVFHKNITSEHFIYLGILVGVSSASYLIAEQNKQTFNICQNLN